MAMAKPGKDTSKKTMDVTKPGKTAPTATSRPVIISHQPMIEDPMMKKNDTSSAETPDQISPPSEGAGLKSGNKVIQPLSSTENSAPATTETEAAPETPVAAPEKEGASELEPQTADVADEPAESDSSDDKVDEEAAVVDAVVDQASADKKKAAGSEEDKKKNEELQKLVESKKYFVPIGQATKRRNSRNTLFGLIGLFLVLIGAYLLIDAGVVKPGFDVPFDFIKNAPIASRNDVAQLPATEPRAPQANTDPGNPTEEPATFTSTEHGFAFSHPKDATVTISDYLEQESKTGKAYSVSYQPKMTGVFVTRDWTAKDSKLSHTGDFTKCLPDEGSPDVVLTYLESNDVCVKAYTYTEFSFNPKGEPAAVLVAQKRFGNDSTHKALVFTYSPVGTADNKPFTEDSLKQAYASVSDSMVELAKSIKQL